MVNYKLIIYDRIQTHFLTTLMAFKQIPKELAVEIGNFWEEMEELHKESVPQHTNANLSIQKEKGTRLDAIDLFPVTDAIDLFLEPMSTYIRAPEKIIGKVEMAMMTPRSRAPIILNFPMQYLETDL
ncbi:hypothetical protein CHS0354_037656 [Potamilus streckersoni]|uniref:Uncharacterized protein n=1 Tax=Potamilus streckersoni TaxID=2493646 RepID=A0AAE0T7G9_9BIVA|nr:hypothetical protein CHS0354_037656 [Potamilus streckersoni]